MAEKKYRTTKTKKTFRSRTGRGKVRLTGRRKSKKVEYKVISSREWNKALNESLKENDELMRILARL